MNRLRRYLEDREIEFIEWADRGPRWRRWLLLTPFSTYDYWRYLFGKPKDTPWDHVPWRLSREIAIPFIPQRWRGKWYWGVETHWFPYPIAWLWARISVARCRHSSHTHKGKSFVYVHGWDEPIYTCSRCGDETG